MKLEFEFEIGEKVYYNLPESDQGIIVDITWRKTTGIVWYHVVFDPGTGEIPCREFELRRDKCVI